jgi:hypothetical protein
MGSLNEELFHLTPMLYIYNPLGRFPYPPPMHYHFTSHPDSMMSLEYNLISFYVLPTLFVLWAHSFSFMAFMTMIMDLRWLCTSPLHQDGSFIFLPPWVSHFLAPMFPLLCSQLHFCPFHTPWLSPWSILFATFLLCPWPEVSHHVTPEAIVIELQDPDSYQLQRNQ